MLGQVTLVCSLAYDTCIKYIELFSWLKVSLFLREIKKGGEEFFSEKNRGAKTFFHLKKGGRRLFFRKNKGAKTFLRLKKGGEDFFFRQIFPKTLPRYPVNFDRSLNHSHPKGGIDAMFSSNVDIQWIYTFCFRISNFGTHWLISFRLDGTRHRR